MLLSCLLDCNLVFRDLLVGRPRVALVSDRGAGNFLGWIGVIVVSSQR